LMQLQGTSGKSETDGRPDRCRSNGSPERVRTTPERAAVSHSSDASERRVRPGAFSGFRRSSPGPPSARRAPRPGWGRPFGAAVCRARTRPGPGSWVGRRRGHRTQTRSRERAEGRFRAPPASSSQEGSYARQQLARFGAESKSLGEVSTPGPRRVRVSEFSISRKHSKTSNSKPTAVAVASSAGPRCPRREERGGVSGGEARYRLNLRPAAGLRPARDHRSRECG
jgi:hypothetical protein